MWSPAVPAPLWTPERDIDQPRRYLGAPAAEKAGSLAADDTRKKNVVKAD